MAQRLEQTQAAVQTQQLASLQVAVAKLVELPVTELAARVRDEMVDNAALEEKDGRVCAMSRVGHDDFGALGFAISLVVGTDNHQARELAMSTSTRLEGEIVETGEG